MASEAIEPSLTAVAKARAAAQHASLKERALVAALATRYSADPAASRSELDGAYGQAMLDLARHYADDVEIAVLAAEALMDAQPWDYWTAGEAGAKEPKGRTTEILALLEDALARNPDHPGAIHLYIHMLEASDEPERAIAYAERLPELMPGAGHLVHMPSHIFYRIGRYQESRTLNEAAVAADEAFFRRVTDHGIYRGGYYPHNQHFVVVSTQMTGEGEAALAAANKLAQVVTDEAAASIPWVQPIKAAPNFAYAQFGAPKDILALPDPGERFPFVKAMWQYARGIARIKAGDLPGATAEAEQLEQTARTADLTFLESGGVPGKSVVAIAGHVLRGRIAETDTDFKGAIAEYEAAIALQDQLPYMEPPFWYYPVRQSLGELLLKAGRPQDAVEEFEASLEQVPNNASVLDGLLRAQRLIEDASGATGTATELEKAVQKGSDSLEGEAM
jgi:tetratricopeptide (TPR) repeat protein